MKKHILYTAAFCAMTVGLSACDAFLDEDSRTNLPLAESFKTKEQVNAVVAGIYGAVDGNNFYHIRINEIASDDGDIYRGVPWSPAFPSSDNLSLTGGIPSVSDQNIYNAWLSSYTAINCANNLLDNITPEGVGGDEVIYRQFVAEARFLRAFHLFNLVRWFGNVPMPLTAPKATDPATMNLPRVSQERVYEQIIDDFTFASQNLPDRHKYPDQARVSRGTAHAYLGKVYLTMYGWPLHVEEALDEALRHLQIVITDGGDFGYKMARGEGEFDNAYIPIFDPEQFSKYGEGEYVFGVRPAGNDRSRSGYCGLFFRNAEIKPTTELWSGNQKLFNFTDNRMQVSFSGFTASKNYPTVQIGQYQFNEVLDNYFNYPASAACFKYQDIVRGVTGYDFLRSVYYYMRYTEVVMMRAEIYCEKRMLAEAAAELDPIRKRAGIGLIPRDLPYEQLRDVIRDERRREFMYEGIRRFDLLRWGIYVEAMKKKASYTRQDVSAITEHNCYFPIPQRELKTNTNPDMYQNPGYGIN